VPACKNGPAMSPVNAACQPSVMAHSIRSGSSSTGNPSASVWCDQFKKRLFGNGWVPKGS